MPTGLVGYWPLDGDGTEQLGEHGLTGVVENGEWVSGRHGLAFESDGDDAIVVVDPDGTNIGLNSELMMMLAWILPAESGPGGADSNIIVNKEHVFEYGLAGGHQEGVPMGALLGAFGPCWRWWGTVVLPLAEWTHTAVGIDGANEVHYVNGALAESTECPVPTVTICAAEGETCERNGLVKYGATSVGQWTPEVTVNGAIPCSVGGIFADSVPGVVGECSCRAIATGVLISNDEDFRIGARGGDGNSSAFFHGAIDDVMLFSGGLAADEVASVYRALLGGGPTSNFRDGSSATRHC